MPFERDACREEAGLELYSHPEPGDLIDLRTPIPKRLSRRRRPEDHFPEAKKRVPSSREAKARLTDLANEEAFRRRGHGEGGVQGKDEWWRRETEARGGDEEEAGERGGRGVWTTRGSRYAALARSRGTDFHEADGGDCYVFADSNKEVPPEMGSRGGEWMDSEEVMPYPFRRCTSARGEAIRPFAGFRERASLGAKERRRRPWLGMGECGRRYEVEVPIVEGSGEGGGGERSEFGVGALDGGEERKSECGCDGGEGGPEEEEMGATALEDEEIGFGRGETHTPDSGSGAEELDWSWVEELPVSAFDVHAADPGVSADGEKGGIDPCLDRPNHLGHRPKEWGEEDGETRRASSASPPPRRMRRCLAASSPIATLPRGGEGRSGSRGHVPSALGVMPKAVATESEGGTSSGDGRESDQPPEPADDVGGVAVGEPPPPFRASMRRVRPFRLSSRRMVHSAPETASELRNDSGEEDSASPSRLDGANEEGASGSPEVLETAVEVSGGEEVGEGGEGSSESEEGNRSSSVDDGGTGDSNMESGAAQSPFDQWPHGFSSMFACLGCTVGLFSISRFAILSVHFGANFIIQFIILSVVFGIPLYSFHVSIGQYLGAGVIDMWKISPVFQGIGVAILASQALLGIYSIVGVSWMFIYFRDSFITKQDFYRWAEPFELYREGSPVVHNGSYKLEETVPDYFSGIVLQRHNLSTSESNFGHLKFQLVFNLAVVWMIIFVCLCKGLKSYGKVVYVFVPLAVLCITVVCIKMLGITPLGDPRYIFHETVWSEFFLNSKCWVAAALEAFFTWGLLGASAMQITSHNAGIEKRSGCKKTSTLHRDTIIVISLTMFILLLSAFLGNACVRLLHIRGDYEYMPSSFEKISTYAFLWPLDPPDPVAVDSSVLPPLPTTPTRYMTHVPLVAGVQIAIPWGPINFGWSQSGELEFLREATSSGRSGYQSLRMATELVPATFALLGTSQLSPFWAVIFYFMLILFGIAQQLAIWHCVITGITAINVKKLKVWETTITFFACAFGFVLGLPMTTELGIFVVHFLDYCLGCGWWMMALYLTELGSVLVIRGRPYGGENVVTALFPSLRSQQNNGPERRRRNNPQPTCLAIWAAPTLAFAWNVMLPVALMVLAITVFKNGNFRSLYNWSVARTIGSSYRGFDDPYIHFRGEDFEHAINHSYWPVWTRQVGSFLQLIPLLAVPFIALIQTIRYLSSGSPDLFERMQALYRPHQSSSRNSAGDYSQGTSHGTGNGERGGTGSSGNNGTSNGTLTDMGINGFEDPPPKYTPPPSYTTATGARIAKLLRQSFRRSMRRLTTALGEAGGSQGDVGGNFLRPVESGDGPSLGIERNTCYQQNRLSLPQLPSSTIAEQEGSSSPQPPPDYASVLVEIRQALRQNLQQGGRLSNTENNAANLNEDSTELQRATAFVRAGQADRHRISTATPERVATLLRSSGRRPNHLKSNVTEVPTPSNATSSTSIHPNSWRASLRGSAVPSGSTVVSCGRPSESVECLVERAAPIHEESSSVDDSVPNRGGEDNLGLDIQGMPSSAI